MNYLRIISIFVVVRIITHILILTIFFSTIQLGKAMVSIQETLLGQETTMSCCSSKSDLTCSADDESENEQEKDDCCKGDDCQCACCLHLVYFKQYFDNFAQTEFLYTSPHSWKFNYSKEFELSVFHPPLI